MKYIALFLLIFLLHFQSVAQQSEPLIATISYDFTHVFDTSNRSSPLQEKMNLYVGATSTCYKRAPVTNTAPRATAAKTETVRPMGAGSITVRGMPMAVVSAPNISDGELFQNASTGALNACIRVGTFEYVVEDKLPVINWQVATVTKTIGDFKCQQATGSYAGRTYTVWFAPDLPFRNGPWKLNGLPGLILEGTDATGDVSFVFTGFAKADSGQVTAYPKTKLITTTEKALKRLRDAFDDNPVATMQAQLPADAPAPTPAYREASGKIVRGEEAQTLIDQKKNAKKALNNPLELKP